MTTIRQPMLPIPEPQRANMRARYAYPSVSERLPIIGRRMLAENSFSNALNQQLELLFSGIPLSPIMMLEDTNAPDFTTWQRVISPLLGLNWLDIPWFFAETYFYRCILDITGFFQPGENYLLDPFRYQKQEGLKSALPDIRQVVSRLDHWLHPQRSDSQALLEVLSASLWGNQVDLSLWPVDESGKSARSGEQDSADHLILNDAPQAAAALMTGPQPRHLQVLVDNAGLELVYDLVLADVVLTRKVAQQVTLQLKAHPTFVSDATRTDVNQTLEVLLADSDPAVTAFAHRLSGYLSENRLELRDPIFWTTSSPLWEMPDELAAELSKASLIISKGDANYRRLLGDRLWDAQLPLSQILTYLPAPLLSLRVIKSDLIVGMPAERMAALYQIDPHWMINGKWGIMQAAL